MSIILSHDARAALGRGLTGTALAALYRWRPDTFWSTVSQLLNLSWSVHLLAQVDVLLPTGRKREAVELLTDAGFQLHVSSPTITPRVLPMQQALVMRPTPVDEHMWRWRVGYDTYLPIPAAPTAAQELAAMPAWNNDAAGVALQATVTVLASVAEIDQDWPASRPAVLR